MVNDGGRAGIEGKENRNTLGVRERSGKMQERWSPGGSYGARKDRGRCLSNEVVNYLTNTKMARDGEVLMFMVSSAERKSFYTQGL